MSLLPSRHTALSSRVGPRRFVDDVSQFELAIRVYSLTPAIGVRGSMRPRVTDGQRGSGEVLVAEWRVVGAECRTAATGIIPHNAAQHCTVIKVNR